MVGCELIISYLFVGVGLSFYVLYLYVLLYATKDDVHNEVRHEVVRHEVVRRGNNEVVRHDNNEVVQGTEQSIFFRSTPDCTVSYLTHKEVRASINV